MSSKVLVGVVVGWVRQRIRKADPYPCVDPSFATRLAAEVYMRERAERGPRLVEQPRSYLCLDGHWHVRMRFDSPVEESRNGN